MDPKQLISAAEALQTVPFGVYLFLSGLLFLVTILIGTLILMLKSRWGQAMSEVSRIRQDLDSLVEVTNKLSLAISESSSLKNEMVNFKELYWRDRQEIKTQIDHLEKLTISLNNSHIQVKSVLMSKGLMTRESDIDTPGEH